MWEIPRRDFCPWAWCNTRRWCVPYSIQCTYRCGGAEMACRFYGQHDNYKSMTTKWWRGIVCPCYFMLPTVGLNPWITNGNRMQISTSVIFLEITPAWNQILRRLKLLVVILEQFEDGARWKAINADTKVPEMHTPRGKGKELCVPFLLVEKLWHWDPYNLTYVHNMKWMLLVQLSSNQ